MDCHLRYYPGMRLLLVLALLGCSKPSTPSASDQLWGLVPAGARGAIVISPNGVAMLERGAIAVQSLFDSSPDFAVAKQQLADWLAPLGGTAPKLADFGLAPSKGAALFFMQDGMVAVLPVADRDKFLAKVNGTKGTDTDKIDTATCKLLRGHYACATAESMLATLGQGDLKKHLAEVKARGEIEIVGAELPFGTPPVIVAAAIQLVRGGATLRGTVVYPPKQIADLFPSTGTPKLDPARTAGFALLDLPAWLPQSDEPVVGDITVKRLLGSLAGPMSVVTPAGVQTMVVEQPTNDPSPLKAVVERCHELPGADVIAAKSDGTVCHFKAPNWEIELDMWMDGTTLRIGTKTNPPAGKPVPMTPLGAELARGPWSLVFWGRGTMLAGPPKPGVEAVDVPAESAMVIRIMSLLNEVGFGARRDGDRVHIVASARTLFANPEPVLAKLFAISAKDIAATRAGALAEPIARSAPTAPFAHDFAAGHAGLLLPTALVGAGVSLIVPALMLMRQTELPPVDDMGIDPDQ